MEVLKQRAGINMLNVPYRDGAPSAAATITGETQALFAGASSAGQFEAGNLRPLAANRQSAVARRFADLPTVGEDCPGVNVDVWLAGSRPGRHAPCHRAATARGGARKPATTRYGR